MNRRRLLTTAAALVLCATGARAEGFDFSRFKPTTLVRARSEFLATARRPMPGIPEEKRDRYMDLGGARWRVGATYTGRSRPLAADELDFIRGWLKTMQIGGMEDLFTTSYLFSADGQEFWLPVETQVAGFFTTDLKPGDAVTLYLAEIGGPRRKDGWVWLPLVEEFTQPGSGAG